MIGRHELEHADGDARGHHRHLGDTAQAYFLGQRPAHEGRLLLNVGRPQRSTAFPRQSRQAFSETGDELGCDLAVALTRDRVATKSARGDWDQRCVVRGGRKSRAHRPAQTLAHRLDDTLVRRHFGGGVHQAAAHGRDRGQSLAGPRGGRNVPIAPQVSAVVMVQEDGHVVTFEHTAVRHLQHLAVHWCLRGQHVIDACQHSLGVGEQVLALLRRLDAVVSLQRLGRRRHREQVAERLVDQQDPAMLVLEDQGIDQRLHETREPGLGECSRIGLPGKGHGLRLTSPSLPWRHDPVGIGLQAPRLRIAEAPSSDAASAPPRRRRGRAQTA